MALPRRRFLRVAVVVAGLIAAAAVPLAAQNSTRNIFSISLGAGFPMGAFRASMGQDGGQINLSYARRPRHLPLYFGFDLDLFIYGISTREEDLVGIPEMTVDVETDNNIVQGLFFVRFQPGSGAVQPYVEGLAGVNYLFTNTTVTEQGFPYDEIATHVNFSSFALAAGVGAGVDIHLWGGRPAGGGLRTSEWFLDVKGRYLTGSRARYLKEGSIIYQNGKAIFVYQESTTNILSVQVGLTARF